VVEIVVKRGGRCRYTTIQNWSNNVYNLVTKRAAAYADATMEWIDGNIGCLAEGSRVTTRSGLKPIELLQPGEEIASFDGGKLVWRKVLAKRFSGVQPVREVRVGERVLRVTDNHPFFSYRYDPSRAKKSGRYELGYVRADELERAIVPVSSPSYGISHKLDKPPVETSFMTSNQYRTGLAATRSRLDRLDLPDETNDDLTWLFGLFLGDGSIDSKPALNGGKRWSKVVFSVPVGDRAYPRLVEVMSKLAPNVQPRVRKDGIATTWNSVALADFFELNGFSTGATQKSVPDWIVDLPESERLLFIAGLVDSDGCAPAGRRGLSIKSVNPSLLEGVADVLTSLGIMCRITVESSIAKPVTILGYQSISRGTYRIDFPADVRLLDHLSQGLRTAVAIQPTRKLRHFRKVGRSTIDLPETVAIHRVSVSEVVGSVPTWDIEVEGTGNFVSEGFIVHNSRLTMKYPAVWLMEPGAHGEVLSIAFASEGQHQDAGAKMVHAAPNTTSTIISKSISKNGGRAGYRGLVRVEPGASNSKSFVRCDALILDEKSRSDTYPYMEIEENDAEIGHEATVSKVGQEQLFYLMSRGLTEEQATSMIVAGFIEPIVRELPMEYAVEMNRLIELNMAAAGAVG
jgi:Fe-S cluster assembly scaffold protein SufB